MAEKRIEKEKLIYAYLAEHADVICEKFSERQWNFLKSLLRDYLEKLRSAKDEDTFNRIRRDLFTELLIFQPIYELVKGVDSGTMRITARGILEKTHTPQDWETRIPENVRKRMRDEQILRLVEDALKAVEKAAENRCWEKR